MRALVFTATNLSLSPRISPLIRTTRQTPQAWKGKSRRIHLASCGSANDTTRWRKSIAGRGIDGYHGGDGSYRYRQPVLTRARLHSHALFQILSDLGASPSRLGLGVLLGRDWAFSPMGSAISRPRGGRRAAGWLLTGVAAARSERTESVRLREQAKYRSAQLPLNRSVYSRRESSQHTTGES